MADKTFNLQIISPTRVFLDEEVDMVEMKTTEGEIGVLAGHIPLTAILEPGELKIHQDGKIRRAAMLDGFVEIRGHSRDRGEVDVRHLPRAHIRNLHRFYRSDCN